jgi:hypothetical protein
MSYAPPSPPDPGNTAFTSRRSFKLGKWLVAVPAHLTLVGTVLVGLTSEVAFSEPVAGPVPSPSTSTPNVSPSPSATTRAPAASPSPSRTVGRVVTASPTPEPTRTYPPSAAMDALEALTVAAPGPMEDYDREAQFGDWIDADGDCEDTRNEVLNRELTDLDSDDGCTVASGRLDDPYTATTVSFTRGVATSSDVQIDHVVAAGNAWASGARELSQAERVEFYNDPLNLLAVEGSINAVKSDSPADEWLPPEESFRCEYVATQIAVKAKYELSVTIREKDAMADTLADCPGQELPTGAPFGDMTGSSGTQDPSWATETPAPATEGVFVNCTEARAAGAAPLYRGSPEYASDLDGDLDGVACED